MTKIVIRTQQCPMPVARYSQGIMVDNTLYVQGIIALDPQTGKLVTGDILIQAERVFESIRAVVETARMTLADVVTVRVFLSNLADYPVFNQIYDSYFPFDSPPVRTTVQAGLPFGALLEVEVIACRA